MCVLKLTIGKISGRLILESEWMRHRRPDSKVTRPDACGLSLAYVAMRVRTGTPLVLKTLAAASLSIPHSISLLLLSFSSWFLETFALSRPILSSCAYISFLQVFFF